MRAYFDNNATTAADPRVVEAMTPWLARAANAASLHRAGRQAQSALEEARARLAALVGAQAGALLLTSGASEANALAIKGSLAGAPPGRILVSAVEHSAVLGPARQLERAGFRLELIPVSRTGQLDYGWLEAQLSDDVRLVSVMWANNETGAVQDVARVAALAREHGALFHCDAAQAVGKWPVDFAASGAHFLSLSAHKFHGPQGVGALVRDTALDLEPLWTGGGQESGLRPGTEPIAAVVGAGCAADIARSELTARIGHMSGLRERLEAGLEGRVGIERHMIDAPRLPNTVSCALPGIDGQAALLALDRLGYAVSTGSACARGQASHVLEAMGVAPDLARATLRISLGKDNTATEVDGLLQALDEVVRGARGGAVTGWR